MNDTPTVNTWEAMSAPREILPEGAQRILQLEDVQFGVNGYTGGQQAILTLADVDTGDIGEETIPLQPVNNLPFSKVQRMVGLKARGLGFVPADQAASAEAIIAEFANWLHTQIGGKFYADVLHVKDNGYTNARINFTGVAQAAAPVPAGV